MASLEEDDLANVGASGIVNTKEMTAAEMEEFRLFMDRGDAGSEEVAQKISANAVLPAEVQAAVARTASVVVPPSPKKPSRSFDVGATSYRLRRVRYEGREASIVCQNSNGPCPLIAICNILLLRDRLRFVPTITTTTTEELIHQLSDLIFNQSQKIEFSERSAHEHNVATVLELMPKLPFGLDINVRFKGVRDFEFTAALTIFDLLGIPLFHGWIVDPQDSETLFAFENMGYNEAIEFLSNCEDESRQFTSPMEALQTLNRGAVLSRFFEHNATQLTYFGLSELHDKVKDQSLSVLFRNNHFHVMTKRYNKIFTLVTDVGYAESGVVWEHLATVEGDSQFYDANFNMIRPRASGTAHESAVLENDMQFAMELQRQEEEAAIREQQRHQQQHQHYNQQQPQGFPPQYQQPQYQQQQQQQQASSSNDDEEDDDRTGDQGKKGKKGKCLLA